MALATLSIDIVAQLSKMQEGMDKAGRIAELSASRIEGSFSKLGALATGIGGALAGAFAGFSITEFIKSNVDALDALNDVKDATGASIENLSALEDVARKNGGTLEEVSAVLVRFNKVLLEADGKNGVSKALASIGMDADELRKMDPAEALQKVAVALSGYEDNGSKARLMQVMLGKSIKEAGPFLKNLAEAGRLNAAVTTKQAEEAKKFNDALFELKTQSSNASRSLVSELVPAMSKTLQAFNAFKSGPGILAGTLEVFKGNSFRNAQEGLTFYADKLKEVDGVLAKLDAAGGKKSAYWSDDKVKGIREQRVELAKFVEVYRGLLNDGTAGGGRGSAQVRALPSLPELGGHLDEKKREFVNAIRDAQALYKNDFLRSEKSAYTDLMAGPALPVGPEIDPELLQSRIAAIRDMQSALASTPIGQTQQLRDMLQTLREFGAEGGNPEQVAQAVQMINKQLDELAGKSAGIGQAIQENLGSGLKMALKSDWQGLGQMLENILLDGVVKDLEKLIKSQLGSLFTGGSGNSSPLGLVFSSFGVPGFASGGQHAGGLRIVGENGPELESTGRARIWNAGQTAAMLKGGGAVTFDFSGQSIAIGQGVSRAEVFNAVQQANRASETRIRRLMSTGRLG